VIAALAACAPKAAPLSVAVVVDGDPQISPTAVDGLSLAPRPVPAASPPPAPPRADAIVRARTAYAKGDFTTCESALAELDVTALLAAHDRGLAARTLFVAAACKWGATDKTGAQAIATRFASYGLAVPEVAVSPDVESAFGAAITVAGRATHAPLQITGEAGARLSLDGNEPTCTLPCTVDVVPGDHVLAVDTDGFVPAVKLVRTPSAPIAIEQQPAPAELAAMQWRARVGRGLPAADVVGARLLSHFVATSRIAYVHADTRLTGALVVDGKLVASATRDRGDEAELLSDLAYDGGLLHRPAFYQRPWFWIATTAVAAALAGTVWFFNRPVHTRLGP
jgi:hypothetical protein